MSESPLPLADVIAASTRDRAFMNAISDLRAMADAIDADPTRLIDYKFTSGTHEPTVLTVTISGPISEPPVTGLSPSGWIDADVKPAQA